MHYVVSGATSPTGNAVVKRLASKVGPENITCLVLPQIDASFVESLGIRTVAGDVTDGQSLPSLLSPETVYIDMTHPKFFPWSIPEAAKAAVDRVYIITTTAIFSKFRRCSDIYQRGEELIRNAGFTYTIFRPTMIYGTLGDRNMNRLVRFLARYPVFPLFGNGGNLMQPVFTDDLADGIAAAIGNSVSENQAYDLGGPEPITYLSIIDTILSKLGRSVTKVRINPRLAAAIVSSLQWIPRFPINDEQVLRMQEDKAFDISKAVTELGYSPRPFDAGIGKEIEEMRAAGMIA